MAVETRLDRAALVVRTRSRPLAPRRLAQHGARRVVVLVTKLHLCPPHPDGGEVVDGSKGTLLALRRMTRAFLRSECSS